MKKRFLSIFFIALALLLLVACGETETKFKVTFNANNGDDNVIVEVIKGETVGKPSEDPTKDGYEFKGWQKDGVNYVFETPVEADFTLVAKWDEVVIPPVEFTVVFKDYDGTVLKTETVVQNANATPPTNPNNKEGHTFDKWDKAYTTVKGDLEVTALYVINTYTVTFKDHDGEVIDTQTVNWNENATPPLDPSREGHLFDKWDKSFDNIKADTTITALYIINEYTVTFLDEDESPIDEVKVDWNTLVTLPATPEKVGYDFVGWFTSEDEAFDELTPITEDLTLVAKWELNAESKLNQVADTLSVLFEDPDNITAGFSLPTKFLYDITGVWTSEFNDIVRLSAPNAEGQVTASVRRPFFEVGHKEVKLSILLTLGTETKEWDIDLTVKSLSEDVITGTDFGDLLTKENAGKEIVVSGVALYKPLGTNGYYLSTEDGVVAYVNGQTGMPEADKLFEMTATVDNYFNSLQLKDLSFFEIDGDVDHVVEYDLKTINDIVAFPKPSASNVYGHDTYKFKDVRIVVQGTGNYNTFIVDKDFFGERTENNSIMLYYTSQINELRALEGEIIAEIDLILEGYRTDLNIWYFSYVLPMEDVLKPALTDEVKFAVDRNKLPEFVDYKVAGDIPLPDTGSKYESPIVWSYTNPSDDNNQYIDLETKQVILPESTREEVKLTATVGTGEDAVTRNFVIYVGEHTLKTVADAVALAKNKSIMVKGVVTDFFANQTYGLQDATGSIAIYTPEELVIGREYTIIGVKDEFNGLHQLKFIEIVSVSVSQVPEPTAIDSLLNDNELLKPLIAGRVSIEGAEVVEVGTPNSYNNINVKIKKNGVTLEVRYDSRVADGEKALVLEGLKVGDIVNYVGNLGWYNGPQLGFGPNTFIGEGWPEAEEKVLVVEYDFTKLDGAKGTQITTEEKLIEVFDSAASDKNRILSATNIDRIYEGNGSGGGEFENAPGVIKTGTSSVTASMTLTFDSNVEAITLTLRGWTASDKVTINGQTKTAPSTVGELVFTFDTPTNVLVFGFDKRVLMTKMVVDFGSGDVVEPVEPEIDELDIADFLDLEVGKEAVITGVITSLAPYNSYSIEDETGAVALRIGGKNSSNIDFEVGDVVKATVKLTDFKGLYQAEVTGGYEVVTKSINGLPVIDLDEETLSDEFLLENQSRIVEAKDAVVVSASADSFGTPIVVIQIDGLLITIKYDNRMPGFEPAFLLSLKKDDLVDITNATITVANDLPLLMIDNPNQVTNDTYDDVMEKAAFAKDVDSFKFDALTLKDDTTLTLPETYKDAAVVWSATEGSEHINLETGLVTIPSENATLKLKAVYTKGDLTEERTYEFTLSVPVEGEVFHETFEGAELSTNSSSYTNVNYTGVNGVEWEFTHSMSTKANENTTIDEQGVMLRRADEPSKIKGTFVNGIKEFSFEYRKALTSARERTYEVKVTNNGESKTYTLDGFGSGSGAKDDIYEFKLEGLELVGEVIIEIYAIGSDGNQQASFDNFKWVE